MKKMIVFIIIALVIAFSGCAQQSTPNQNNSGTVNLSQVVEKGDTIKVEYKGTFENGEEFDSSAKFGKPLEFEAGAGQMIKGFDSAVIGMRLNSEKNISLKPEDAYGFRDESKIIEIPKDRIADFDKLKEGMTISSPQAGNGTVIKKTANSATIDFNHPMAGKTLKFWIKIVAIKKAE